jgi:hypothetical protein
MFQTVNPSLRVQILLYYYYLNITTGVLFVLLIMDEQKGHKGCTIYGMLNNVNMFG